MVVISFMIVFSCKVLCFKVIEGIILHRQGKGKGDPAFGNENAKSAAASGLSGYCGADGRFLF